MGIGRGPSGGGLVGFGDNTFGQLGVGAGGRCWDEPLTALDHEPISSVACGRAHTLAATSAGTVYAWGCGRQGRTGLGNNLDHPRPCLVSGLRGVHVVQVACGAVHSMALDHQGSVWVWGTGRDGQLGHGQGGSLSRYSPHPKPVLALRAQSRGRGVRLIAAGWRHSLALADTRVLYVWGSGAFGCTGQGKPLHRHTHSACFGPERWAGRTCGLDQSLSNLNDLNDLNEYLPVPVHGGFCGLVHRTHDHLT